MILVCATCYKYSITISIHNCTQLHSSLLNTKRKTKKKNETHKIILTFQHTCTYYK